MIMRRLAPAILVMLLLAAHYISLQKITAALKALPKNENTAYVVPPTILRITALEFQGIISDYLFLKSLVFIGSTIERTERPRVKTWEWKWLYNIIDASSSLDPYFFDPYYFSEANFTWDAMMIEDTNLLLERGVKYRPWDSTTPFFIGFNYFYFLRDNFNARKYLIEASRRPDAQDLYADLAAKLSSESKRTENAISFLEGLLKGTEDEVLRKRYEARIAFLRGVLEVEHAVELYKKRFARKPVDISVLVRSGMLREVPADPSGGQLFLDYDGSVKSISELQPGSALP